MGFYQVTLGVLSELWVRAGSEPSNAPYGGVMTGFLLGFFTLPEAEVVLAWGAVARQSLCLHASVSQPVVRSGDNIPHVYQHEIVPKEPLTITFIK